MLHDPLSLQGFAQTPFHNYDLTIIASFPDTADMGASPQVQIFAPQAC